MAILPPIPPITLIIGGVPLIFLDWAIPDNVRFNPTQNVYIHKFIGGARRLDVMGRDDDVIKWSGTFLGTTAPLQAQVLKAYCVTGNEGQLMWGGVVLAGGTGFLERVVIKQVQFDYKSQFMIDYSIEVYVIHDADQGLLGNLLGGTVLGGVLGAAGLGNNG